MPAYTNYTTDYHLGYPQGGPGYSDGEMRKAETIDSILELNDRLHEPGIVLSEGTYSGNFVAGASTVTLDTLVAGIPYSNRKLLVNSTNVQWTGLADSTTYWLYATVVPASDTQYYSTSVIAAKVASAGEPAVPANSILLARAVTTGVDITVTSSEVGLGTTTNKKWFYDMWTHRTAAVLGHPDASVTDVKIAAGIDPAKTDDYSADLAEMRTTVDPFPGATPVASLATDLIGEIARLRYQLDLIIGEAYWYEDPDTDLYTAAAHIGDTSDPHGATMSVSVKVQTPEIENAEGAITVDGGQIVKRTTTATNYDTLVSDYYIGVTNTGAPRTVQLMSATVAEGRVVVIKDESGGAAANNITVTTEGAETIDGGASVVISSNYGSVSLVCNGTNWFAFHISTDALGFTVDGGGLPIQIGSKGYLYVPYSSTITAWTILADQSGSIVIDVKKCTYAGFPTTVSIAASAKPTLSSAQKNQDLTLTGWTTAISAGDILEFVVDSASTVTRVNLVLTVTRN